MVHEAAEKCQKKVSSSIFPKKDLFRKMGRGGGVFNIALVPLQDEQLAVDLAIWPSPQVIVRFDRKNSHFNAFWPVGEQYWSTSVLKN